MLSFQGPDGGLTFPMNGVSLHWFASLFEPQAVGDFGGSLDALAACSALMVMVGDGGGLARRRPGLPPPLPRRRPPCSTLTVASLIVPSILVSLGIGLLFSLLGLDPAWYSSAFGAQLTWTLPFGLLIMFAVFNRFNRAYEEAARDLGASPWQTLPPCRAADHRAERGRRRAVRLHPVL